MSRPASYVGPSHSDLVHATINFGLISHTGEGKTVFWGSGGGSVLFLSSDPEGTISAEALGHKFHKIEVTDYEELQEAYEWLKESSEPKTAGIRWVIWDSVTLFQDRVLIDDIMPDAVADNPKQEEFVPSRREYLINMNRIGRYVRLLVDLPFNCGFSFHVMTTTESGGDGTILMPQVQGKNMPSKIAGYMNVLGYMSKVKAKQEDGKETVVQRILFQREGRVYAKDRWNALGHHMDKPTLPKVEELIEKRRETLRKAVATPTSAAAAPPPTRRRRPTIQTAK
jgi:hypothetical protein